MNNGELWYSAKDEPAVEAYFYTKDIINPAKSLAAGAVPDSGDGKEVYDQKTYIKIRVKGQTDIVDRPINIDKDIARFDNAWRVFEGQQVEQEEGTPLNKLAGINAGAMVKLNARGIRTIEDLAGVSDAIISSSGIGMLNFKRAAERWMETEKKSEENNKLKKQLAAMQEQINALAKQKPPAKKETLKIKKAAG